MPGYYGTTTPAVLPLTGNEILLLDTEVAQGVAPQTVGITTAALGVQTTSTTVFWAIGGAVQLATAGNNTTMVAGTTYWADVQVEAQVTLTGICVLVGGTGGTDSWIVALYSNTGVLLANSALAGTTAGTASNLQKIPFTATRLTNAGRYFIALQSNGTTAKFQSYTIPGAQFVTGSTTGSFGTLINPLTVGTTYTNNVGPIASTY